jgi:hypothetical protein
MSVSFLFLAADSSRAGAEAACATTISGQVPNAPDLLVLSSFLSFQVVNSGGDVDPKQFDIMMAAGTHTPAAEPACLLLLKDMTAWLSRMRHLSVALLV